jgi:transcriptional regulator with GAF, ATPase, and Fis domain/tetratricopeptide (TPR) repeat protein
MSVRQGKLKDGSVVAGRYRVEGILGCGRAGDVYACRDLCDGSGDLVLRMLGPVDATGEEGHALRTTLSMLVRLRHPGLVPVLDFGIAGDSGALFLTEERVEGASLRAAAGNLAPEKALALGAELAATLHHLHGRGIVHGDLRSSTILLVGEGEAARPVILGYGVRRFLPDDGDPLSPSCAAPELLLGGRPTARSDIYALGILLYLLICGRFPFEDDDEGFLIQKQLQAGVDLRPIESLRRGGALALLLGRMLEKDPENRTITALEAAAAIGGLVRSDGPVWEPECRFSAAPFVGREREMQRVQARARRVRESGRGWTLFLAGEAGAGKTRFMEEMRSRALLEGWHVAEGACGVREESAYAPYRQVLSQLDPEGEPSLFEQAVRTGSSDPGDGASGFATGQFQDQLTRELVRRLGDAPTLLLLHDFHNADRSSCAVLDYLGSDIHSHPVLACVSLRSGEESSGYLEAVMETAERNERGEVLTLEPLDRESLRRMAVGITGSNDLPAALDDWLYRAVGGNPLFLEQMLKHLLEQGALRRSSGVWKFFEGSAKDLEVPAEVGSVLTKRLQSLPPPARNLADWLALRHRPVATDSLAPAMSWSPCRVAGAVAELRRRQMVRVESAGDRETVDFSHELIPEVVRRNLPKGAAPRMHRKIAEGILREKGGAGRFHELAHHYIEGRAGVASIPTVLASAARSRAEFAHEKALRCYEHVFSRPNGLTDEEACRAAIDASDTMFALGMAARALALLRKILGRHRSVGPEVRARMYMQMALACQYIGNVRMQEAYCRKGLDVFDRHPAPGPNLTRAMLWAELAFIAVLQSSPRKGLSCLDKALAACPEKNATALRGRIQNLYSWLYRVAGDFQNALRAGRTAVNILSKSEESHLACSAYSTLGFIQMGLGRLPLSLENHVQAVSWAEKSRSVALRSQALANLTECLCRMGRIQDSLKESSQAAGLIEDCKIPTIRNPFNAILAELSLASGQYREAGELVSEICGEGKDAASPFTIGHAHYVAAELSLYLGGLPEALRHIEELSRYGSAEAPLYEHELAEGLRARMMAEQGRGEEALKRLRALDRAVTRKHWPYQMCIIRLHLGEVLFQCGRPVEAERYGRNALRLARGMGAGPLMQKAHLLLGSIYSPCRGRSGEAVTDRNKAVEQLDLCIRGDESFAHHESLWRAHAELSLLYGEEGDQRRSYESAEKAYAHLCRLEGQLPPEALVSFYTVFGRSRLKLELLGAIEKGRTQRPIQVGFEGPGSGDRNARTLQRLSAVITSAGDLDYLLEALLDQLLPAIGMTRAFVYLCQESSGRLRPAKGRGIEKVNLTEPGSVHREVVETVFHEGIPIVSADCRRDPRIRAPRGGGGRLMCAPLKAPGRVIGVLYAEHDTPSDGISEPVINLFAAACSLTALGIANLLMRPRPPEIHVPPAGGRSDAKDPYPEIVGKSPAICALKVQIGSVAASPLDVLITGESGTGKELVARAIHRTNPGKRGKFLSVDCGALSESLVESELFGFRRGAFTGALEDRPGCFEAADGGVLFLDEFSNLPLTTQVKFLRVIQEREVRRIGEMHTRKLDIRIITASNRILLDEVRAGRFREDLYYRIKIVQIPLPPLRERGEDIPLLIDWFLEMCAKQKGFRRHVGSKAMDLLLRYSYPGNVRELGGMIQGIYYNGNDPVIDVGELPPEVLCGRFSGPLADPDPAERIFRAILDGQGDFEELVKAPFLLHQMGAALVSDIIGKALAETNGNYRMALRLLRVPDRRYTSTLQFLKRNGCYLPYRTFRKKGGDRDGDF